MLNKGANKTQLDLPTEPLRESQDQSTGQKSHSSVLGSKRSGKKQETKQINLSVDTKKDAKTKNAGEAPPKTKNEYVELKNWWKTHKHSLKRGKNDLMPMDFADKTSWEIMTNAIIDPDKEGK